LAKEDFLTFRKMITPVVIQVLFWLGVASVVIGTVIGIANGQAMQGLLLIILGPIAVRVYCELLIVIFKINDTLTEIRNQNKPMGG
jgi:hypothetical protein